MKSPRLIAPLAFTTALVGMPFAAPAGLKSITFAGGDGSTLDKAVVIKGATAATGVHAEYEWLTKHFPGYKMKEQALTSRNGRSYDVLHFTTPDGKAHEVYFDITDFFGK